MARRWMIGRGRAQVELSSGLQDVVNRVLSKPSYEALVSRLESEADALRADAQRQWPVGRDVRGRGGGVRPKSRDALQTVMRLQPPNLIEAVVQIDPSSEAIEYVYYIKSPKVGKQGRGTRRHVYTTLIRKPGEERARGLARDLIELLASLAQGE
jgi:hypothetical protein